MKKETLFINLFGGPGTAKSTTAALVFGLLKLHDVDSELITEVPKDFVWDESWKLFENQNLIFGMQDHRYWRLNGKIDVAVSDSPFLLGLVYGNSDTTPASLFQAMLDRYSSYNSINIFIKRNSKYNPNGRNETEEQALALDTKILNMLQNNNVPFDVVEGTYNVTNHIVDMILKKLGIEGRFFVGGC